MPISAEKLVEGSGALSVIIHISSGTSVSVMGKMHKGGGCVGTGYGSGVHFAKDHTGGFNEAEGCVYGEEFAGRARAEGVSIVHAEMIRYPIEVKSRELC